MNNKQPQNIYKSNIEPNINMLKIDITSNVNDE